MMSGFMKRIRASAWTVVKDTIAPHIFCVTIVLIAQFPFATLLSRANDAKIEQTQQDTASPSPIPTTPHVSRAMREIRTIVRNNHSLVTHRRLGVAQAQVMARRVKSQVSSIKESQPSVKLMNALEPLLQAIEVGVDAIAAPTEKHSRMDGLFQVDQALSDYGMVVHDPEWAGLRKQ